MVASPFAFAVQVHSYAAWCVVKEASLVERHFLPFTVVVVFEFDLIERLAVVVAVVAVLSVAVVVGLVVFVLMMMMWG